jgi:hypothetical protein
MSRGRPFEPGNQMGRGRPRGSRNKRAAEAQQILDEYTGPLMRKCVAKAMEGDMKALALCIERILPAMREPAVRIRMPKLEKVKDIDLALQRIVDNVGNGNITPAEAERFTVILQNHRDNVQDREYEARLTEAEKAPPKP